MTERSTLGPSASLRERDTPIERVGVLTRDIEVRLVDYSSTGCLLETNIALSTGTVGYMSLWIDDREYVDAIEVVRCQPIAGAGALHRLGARFLWPLPAPSVQTRADRGRVSETKVVESVDFSH